MTSDFALPVALVAVAITACTPAPQTPVPLAGTAADVAALTGRWDGSYSSAATGRSGSISFTLTASGDSAFGDVIMIPRGFGRPLQAWNRGASPAQIPPQRPAVLTINFVRVAQGRVTGTLAPYADPETGGQLYTTFEGRLQRDAIQGTFTTRSAGGTDAQTGQWKVTRRAPG
jgi:hypothetical protein